MPEADPMLASFSRSIRCGRLDAEMTQRDVAHHLGVTPSAVSLWESGHRAPELLMAVRMADLFDFDLGKAFSS
jgi:DNA-binding XRE family transcriptional regulator